MKNILRNIIIVAVALATVGCQDFGDTNVNPNSPVSVSPSTLFTNAMRGVSGSVGSTQPLLYSQHMAETQYTDGSTYIGIRFDFNGFYSGALADLKHVMDLNTDEATKSAALSGGSNANQIASARILSDWYWHLMTDRWGPLPYSTALQGKENFEPSYDSQEAIYKGVLSDLKAAIAQIDGGAGPTGDFILDGDMDKWKQFANTIRMTMALRMSEVDPALAQSEFNSAVSAGVLDSDVMYPYLGESTNQNPWFGRFVTRTDWAISNTLVDYMKPLNDPRLNVYADPAPNYGDVRGMPYGIDNAGDIPNAEISFPGFPAVRGQDAPIPIFTRAQIMFSMAEAAQRGWTSGNAEQLYYDGIKASMEQWGVFDQAAYDAFIAQPSVAWDASLAMERIHMQKWVALYLQGYEAWSEWRRVGIPALSPAPDAANPSGQIPVRQGYPASEVDVNEANYNAGVGLLGGADGQDTNLWWDK
jgi:hypothetical protein